MAAEIEPQSYSNVTAFLATAGIVVPLFKRLRISPVLGFLGAGVALGPFGLGRFVDAGPLARLRHRHAAPSRSPASPSSASSSCCS